MVSFRFYDLILIYVESGDKKQNSNGNIVDCKLSLFQGS